MPLDIYTVRMGLYLLAPWASSDVVAFYGPELQKLGFTVPQAPAVALPVTTFTVTPGEFKTIAIFAPPLDPVSQTRDTRVPYADDPAALAEHERAQLVTFVWNICGPVGAAGTLRDLFRRLKPPGALKLSPYVALWSAAPAELAGYPNKPPAPNCTPQKPSGGGGGAAAFGLIAFAALVALLRFRK